MDMVSGSNHLKLVIASLGPYHMCTTTQFLSAQRAKYAWLFIGRAACYACIIAWEHMQPIQSERSSNVLLNVT